MRSTTGAAPAPPALTEAMLSGYRECFVKCGEWAHGYGPEAVEQFNSLFGTFLKSQAPVLTLPAAAQPTDIAQRARSGNARQRTGGQATGRTRRNITASTSQEPTAGARTRSAPGALGEAPAKTKVLGYIIANPNCTARDLQKAFARTQGLDKPQRVGVALRNLLKPGYISGTPRTGPFVPTEAGMEAMRRQPASIGQARARRGRGRTATATTPATEPAAAAAAATG